MADNTQITAGTGDIIATDDIGGIKFQRIKLIYGGDGVNSGDVATSNPLPVQTATLVSTNNSTTSILVAGATFTGTGEDVSGYASVVVAAKTDKDGTLYMEFSPDNTNWDSSLSFPVTASINEVHRLSVTRKYYRCRFTNTAATDQGYLRLQSTFGNQPALTSALNSTVQSDADSLVTRSVLMGENDGGEITFVPVTAEGHLEVAIHGPRLPFGSVHAESLTPVLQTDGVYGISLSEIQQTTGLSFDPGPAIGSNSGSNTGTNNVLKCSTGTTAYSFATMQSRRRLRYRAGQGIVGRFAGLFSAPAASSIVVAGLGTGESGFYFGYNGTSFGILHSTGGVREIQTFTVTNRTTTGGTVTFRLAGLDTQVTLAICADTTATAANIAAQTFPGWSTEARGATVVFLANSVGNKTGTFSITLGTAIGTAGTFAETLAGVASTDTWIAQANWNGDPLDGTGPSGETVDWSKGNVFQIGIQYLGFGAITFSVETCPANGNNAEFVVVHTIKAPNTRTTTTLTQPSFPFTMAAYSAGSTTDVSVSIGSFAGFVEGQKRLTGPRMSYFNTVGVTSSTSAYTPIFSVRNDYVYALRANQAVVNLLSIGGATKSTTGITSFYLIRNATLSAGVPNWTSYSTQSCTFWDTAATACTFSDNAQIIWTGATTGDGQFVFSFTDDLTLQPGETMTLAVRSVTGTATCIGQVNTREDQ
jgi:hypothetical protein